MIQAGEIQKLASGLGVLDTQIEKDYVIGWILKGISQNNYLSEHLVFKGGTVLKKVWFDDYRFSEDMDFTFQGDEWSTTNLENELKAMCAWVYEESRIELNIKNAEGSDTQYRCYIAYKGPLGGEKDIKCDISTDEHIAHPVEQKKLLDNYSDQDGSFSVNAYSLEESLAEKLRCVIQRTIPRDIYDIWYLTEKAGIDIQDVTFGFKDKTEHKDHDPLSIMDVLQAKERKYKASWENSLKHQVKNLPEFDQVWREVNRQVRQMTDLLKS